MMINIYNHFLLVDKLDFLKIKLPKLHSLKNHYEFYNKINIKIQND